MASRSASWRMYRDMIGDRSPVFAALVEGYDVQRALYPGCYVDLSPSTAIRHVTYVDTDARAARFFGDADLVAAELDEEHRLPGREVDFLPLDYTAELPLRGGEFDLVISLFAGLVWEHVRQHLRDGGLLLANNSHGEASMAALDPSLTLVAAVIARDGTFRLSTDRLEEWLVPKRPEAFDEATVRETGRGAAFTRSAFAYLFRHAGPA